VPIYMKIDKVPGQSTDANFAGQITLDSFQWGAGRACTNAASGDRTPGVASISEVTATKQTDKATEKLFVSLLKGEPVGPATISFVASIKGESVCYAKLILEEVIVSGLSMSSGGDNPTESVSLHFTKFDWTYSTRDAKQAESKTHLSYDLVLNQYAG
jgi:type VI secretion system secreted protein Hcp